MQAQDGRTYAQIAHGKIHWLFTASELLEWNNDMCPAVDITDLSPRPEIGWGYDGATFAAPAAVLPSLDDIKVAACAEIDQTAGTTRTNYITTSTGQEATYTEKARQCEAYKATGYPATPDPVAHAYVIAEANAKGCSYHEACDAILAERDAWAVLGARIEEARRKAKIAIMAATTAEAVEAVKQTGLTELAAL